MFAQLSFEVIFLMKRNLSISTIDNQLLPCLHPQKMIMQLTAALVQNLTFTLYFKKVKLEYWHLFDEIKKRDIFDTYRVLHIFSSSFIVLKLKNHTLRMLPHS